MIGFKAELHTYEDILTKQKYKSVSNVFKKYKKPFDYEFNSARSAMKQLIPIHYNRVKKIYGYENHQIIPVLMDFVDKEQYDIIKNKLVEEWKLKGLVRRTLGTKWHLYMENLELDRGWALNHFCGRKFKVKNIPLKGVWDNRSICENLFDLEDGYYNEMLVHYTDGDKIFIAGQLDRVFIETIGGIRYIDIDDWKIDESINIVPDFFHPKRGYDKLLGGLSHLTETNFNTYNVKISTYMLILEHLGFVCRNIGITNVNPTDNLEITYCKTIKMKYKKEEAKLMISQSYLDKL